MGEYCTRNCLFCDVTTKNPHQVLDLEEPTKIANVVDKLGLKYVVLTSVTRDDLADGGAGHLADCIRKIQAKSPKTLIEILIPDFKGNLDALKTLVEAKPQVIGHNIETTEKMTSGVRDRRASYHQSLFVLKSIKKMDFQIYTKSSIILGFGEKEEGILEALYDLKKVNVDIVTFGQYLQPSRKSLPVHDYITPEKFTFWSEKAYEIGFLGVVSGPLVRSSYQAGLLYNQIHKKL
jgi:lipoic acid synthetase